MSQASSRMVRAAEATAELWSYSWVTSSSTPQLLKPGVLARSKTRSILVLYRRQLCTHNTDTNHALFVILALSLLQFTHSVQSQVRFKACTQFSCKDTTSISVLYKRQLCTHNTDTNHALFVILALSLLQFTHSVQSQVRFKACTQFSCKDTTSISVLYKRQLCTHNTDTNCALFVVVSSDFAVTQTFSIKLGEI